MLLSLRLQTHVLAQQAVSDIVRTTLGPRAMLKMLLDSSGGQLAFVHANVASGFAGHFV